jgi:hypothetical protein
MGCSGGQDSEESVCSRLFIDMKKSIDGGGCSKDNFPGSVT